MQYKDGRNKVTYRKSQISKWDVVGRNGKAEDKGGIRGAEGSSSFFITEFGDKWSAQDLYEEFKSMGDIEEVIISPRRDRRGRRYGFVRIFNVSNDRMLATKLDIVFLEGRKLFANIPRFKRGSKKVSSP